MPQGNVGTPTRHFLEEIQKCRLPGRLVGRLGLRFGGRRPGRYGSVPFDYERLPPDDRELQEDEEEEWDRHEALHDNVTEQERAKERLYEEEQEVTWEKGGPGIVWYTDACRWKEDEGDFDEQTADDWDVDVGVYYRDGDGDKDARDALEMRQSTLWRQGVTESVFRKPSERPAASFSTKFKKKKGKAAQSSPAGSFEQYTRGIGRRLMERQGWKDGLGLGPANAGIVKPVDSDGQTPRERKGFGYSAPPPVRFGVSRSLPAIATEERVIISTVYDRPAETDPAEPLHQRNPTNFLKYRS